ncbi:hypothetical protein GmHk_20G057297 [Glycine max]|nr:hypothetical protein GmHk_20G057297 [Glycine max]
MSTWEDLDDSSLDENNEEEVNVCLMTNASTSKVKPTLDASSDDESPQPDGTINYDGEEVIFESREDLIKGYNQLLFGSTCVSKAYRKLNKHFQHLERKHEDLKKIHQDHLVDFVLETTLPSDVQDNFVCEKVKALLDKNVSSGQKILLKDFQDSKKRLRGRKVLKELSLEIVKLNEEIDTLRDKLGKIFGDHEALNKETPKTNLVMVSKAKRLCMVKKLLFFIFGKRWVMRLISSEPP